MGVGYRRGGGCKFLSRGGWVLHWRRWDDIGLYVVLLWESYSKVSQGLLMCSTCASSLNEARDTINLHSRIN